MVARNLEQRPRPHDTRYVQCTQDTLWSLDTLLSTHTANLCYTIAIRTTISEPDMPLTAFAAQASNIGNHKQQKFARVIARIIFTAYKHY